MRPFPTIRPKSRHSAPSRAPTSRRRGSSNRAASAISVFLASALAAAACGAATNRLAIGFAEYTLSGNRLEIADIADPAKPLPVCHFDLADLAPSAISVSNGVLRVEAAVEFDISDIFAPVPKSDAPVATVTNDCGLVLVACQTNGIAIYTQLEDGRPVPATHCLTDGPALDVAACPGGFGAALGTRGYAIYEMDEFGLVTLKRQWPLETGSAVSATFDGTNMLFDCQEGGVRGVAP